MWIRHRSLPHLGFRFKTRQRDSLYRDAAAVGTTEREKVRRELAAQILEVHGANHYVFTRIRRR